MGHEKGWQPLSKDESQEIAQRYMQGETFESLCIEYKRDQRTLRKAVVENGGKVRPRCWVELTEKHQAEIAKRYSLGDKFAVLKAEYHTSGQTIKNVLAKYGVEVRPNGPRRLTQQQRREVAERYLQGEVFDSLCRKFKCSAPTIRSALAEIGGSTRPRGYGLGRQWPSKWRDNHKKAANSPEFKHISSDTMKKVFKESWQFSQGGSPIEKKLQQALREAGICFLAHSKIRRPPHDGYRGSTLTVDIEICQQQVIIEADGMIHNLQTHKIHDSDRDDFLRSEGFLVFRFTGAEINKSARKCIDEVVDACNLMSDVCQIMI